MTCSGVNKYFILARQPLFLAAVFSINAATLSRSAMISIFSESMEAIANSAATFPGLAANILESMAIVIVRL